MKILHIYAFLTLLRINKFRNYQSESLSQPQISFGENEVLRSWNVVVRYIEANLSGRVNVGGELAETIPMLSGVPQGSVIGPLLYLLFANSLKDALEALTLLFADDVQLITPRKQNMHIHRPRIVAWDWSQKWDLPINPAKCNYLTIGRKVTLRLSLPPMGLVPLSLYPN